MTSCHGQLLYMIKHCTYICALPNIISYQYGAISKQELEELKLGNYPRRNSGSMYTNYVI